MSLHIKQLSVSFIQKSGWLKIVEDLNLSLLPGKTIGLVGESGCGKSLTALSIMRLLPAHAAYGQQSEICLDEKDILNDESVHMRTFRGKRISMVFQEPMVALNPVRTMYQQIADVILAHHSISTIQLQERVLKLMNDVEIDDAWQKLKQYPHQWSGGQKQRFLIAMALANNPQVLLADEPTTALDIVIQKQVLMLLKKLQKQYGLALLLISHNFNVVRLMADQIVVMYAGQMIENASSDEFWHHPRHPYVHQLIHCLPSFDKRDKILTVIPGNVPNFYELPSGCRFHPRCTFATDKCKNVSPSWYPLSDTHLVRCHLYPRSEPIAYPHHDFQQLSKPSTVLHQYILSVRDLSVEEDQKIILQDIHFDVKAGKTLAIVGESGCGKTTLAQTLMGLRTPTKGMIEFDSAVNRKDVQLIFQDPASAMNPRWSIQRILKEGLRDGHDDKIKLILDAVQISHRCLNHYPHELSGGQKQRIAIARALLSQPKILVCDEPTSALDISVQAQILNLLKEIQHDFGLTLLIITHDLGVVGYLADDVLILKQGRIIEKGIIEDIWLKPKHEYTKYLLSVNQFFEEEV